MKTNCLRDQCSKQNTKFDIKLQCVLSEEISWVLYGSMNSILFFVWQWTDWTKGTFSTQIFVTNEFFCSKDQKSSPVHLQGLPQFWKRQDYLLVSLRCWSELLVVFFRWLPKQVDMKTKWWDLCPELVTHWPDESMDFQFYGSMIQKLTIRE